MKTAFRNHIRLSLALVLALELVAPFLPTSANAAVPPFAAAFIRIDRMQAITFTGGESTACSWLATSNNR